MSIEIHDENSFTWFGVKYESSPGKSCLPCAFFNFRKKVCVSPGYLPPCSLMDRQDKRNVFWSGVKARKVKQNG